MKELIGYKKGINLGGWISQKKIDVNFKEDFILEDDIKFIKSIGLDHVRLPVDFEYIYDEKDKVDNPLPNGFDSDSLNYPCCCDC